MSVWCSVVVNLFLLKRFSPLSLAATSPPIARIHERDVTGRNLALVLLMERMEDGVARAMQSNLAFVREDRLNTDGSL